MQRGIRHTQVKTRSILAASVAFCLISGFATGQTTRTNPSAGSTPKSIPSSSSTSANSPCDPNSPNSPCYSANSPRNPCYSAVTPDQPCSTTVTPSSQALPPPPPPSPPSKRATATEPPTERAFTADQAKSQIEARGYSGVSGLRKDVKGQWRGTAMKDGSPVSVTLDIDGKITAK